jgi:haloalkane dehalogenase
MVPEEFSAPLKEAYKTLPVIKAEELDARFRDRSGVPGFLYWRKFCAESPEILRPGDAVIDVVASGKTFSDEEKAAFNAPYPDESYLAGARRFPSLVPFFPDEAEVPENKAAWEVLKQFDKPFMCAFSDDDPVTAGGDGPFLQQVAGCKGVEHRTIAPAGHFLQHEQPGQCVRAILDITGRP